MDGEAGSWRLSTVDVAASLIKRLELIEWQVLKGLEKAALTRGGSTSADAISRITGQPPDRVVYALSELNKKKLVGVSGESFLIYTSSLDLLALKYYADRDYAYALGKLIAKGKESDVYEVLSSTSDLYALKLFRLGRTSFRDYTRKRASSSVTTWMEVNYQGAQREFEALTRLAGVSKNVPTGVGYNRHTVLLGEISGVRLSTRPRLARPSRVLRKILRTVREVHARAGMIHADLSEYNILTDGKEIWLIDWPQWVNVHHPNSATLLRRDISSVIKFFGRVYGLVIDVEQAESFVLGRGRFPAERQCHAV